MNIIIRGSSIGGLPMDIIMCDSSIGELPMNVGQLNYVEQLKLVKVITSPSQSGCGFFCE